MTRLPSKGGLKAFTLIELITVIAIIAILMGLLLPAISTVRNTALKAQAKSDCLNLVTACKAYYTDYGKYPLNAQNTNSGGNNNDTCYGDPGGWFSSADLCDILRAVADTNFNTSNQLNPRQVVYLDVPNAKNPAAPKGGLATQAVTGPAGNAIKAGAFVDPWGMEYVVFLDANYDNSLNDTSPSWNAIANFYPVNTPTVQTGVAAVSLGKDNAWGTKGDGKFNGSDDIASWQ